MKFSSTIYFFGPYVLIISKVIIFSFKLNLKLINFSKFNAPSEKGKKYWYFPKERRKNNLFPW